MKQNKIRLLIISLEFAGLFASLAFRNTILSMVLLAVCTISCMLILYFNLGNLMPSISESNPKMKTLKKVTLFNTGLLIACGAAVLLDYTEIISIPVENQKYLAAFIIIVVIVFTGNMSPKLPFSRHTGLRLPWTVMDEETWIVAHRIIGYLAFPLVLLYLAGMFIVEDFEVLTGIIVALWIGIPSVYSYIFYYKKTHGKL